MTYQKRPRELAFFCLEKRRGRADLTAVYNCLIEDTEKTEPDPSWRCIAMGQETGTRGSKHKLELAKLDFVFNLFIYYHESGLHSPLEQSVELDNLQRSLLI